MNLMDMLWEGAEAVRPPAEFSGLYDNETVDQPSSTNNVYYLPTVFTKLQKDTCEAVVQIFGPALTRQLVAKGQRASINSLLDSDEPVFNGQSDNHDIDSGELGPLLFDQLIRLSRHPSLVVDHFIPKKLLLLEVKDRLLHMSGKLMFFNRLVDLISQKYENATSGDELNDYNLLVLAESVKELEWIEGLIIGKKLNYLNLSAGKLYDEDEKLSFFVKEESVDDEQQAFEFKKRRKHFVARHSKTKGSTPVFTLHLMTSRQLYQGYTTSTPIDMIVSFDSEIDVESDSFELLRTNNKVNNRSLTGTLMKSPVIIPVSLFSIEHIITMLPRPDFQLGQTTSVSEKSWKLKVANAFIANRFRLFKEPDANFYLEAYGRNFSLLLEWLFHWDKVELSPKVKQLLRYAEEVCLTFSDEKLESRLNDNYLLTLGKTFADTANGWDNTSQAVFHDHTSMNYELFKERFAEFLNSRINQAETLIREGNTNILPVFRESEAKRQEEIDKDEELVGNEYRKLRRLNDEANALDRKFNRCENEHTQVLALESETKEMLAHLEDVILNKSEDDLTTLLEEQKSLLTQLEEEKSKLEEEYVKLVEDTELLRTEYQSKSAVAVQAISSLKSAKALQSQLEAKLSGQGLTTLPRLARKDEYLAYEAKLNRLRQENAFIKLFFLARLDQLLKERSAILDSTTSGSSSRLSNRISRASTPFT